MGGRDSGSQKLGKREMPLVYGRQKGGGEGACTGTSTPPRVDKLSSGEILHTASTNQGDWSVEGEEAGQQQLDSSWWLG